MLENSRRKLQSDFEQWYAIMMKQAGGVAAAPRPAQDSSNDGNNKSAFSAVTSERQHLLKAEPGPLKPSVADIGKDSSYASATPDRSPLPKASPVKPNSLPVVGKLQLDSTPTDFTSLQSRNSPPPPLNSARSTTTTSSSSTKANSVLQYTGNPDADRDIAAFYAARASLLKK
mmetsp:Transcript_1607/g.2424  ORF Transcript_1607/g.2424 Transcript_1607/m.2424 type:complete len:173 (-) Transcript_1607:31-549(-)